MSHEYCINAEKVTDTLKVSVTFLKNNKIKFILLFFYFYYNPFEL